MDAIEDKLTTTTHTSSKRRRADGSAVDGRSAGTGRSRKVLAALIFGGVTYGVAALGGRASKPTGWYRSLRKSKATPPAWVFGPVWTALYGTIAYSGYRAWTRPPSAARRRALRLWGTQLALNASWSPLFFGAHRPKASAAVSAALIPAIAAYALTVRKTDKLAAALMLPYLGWSIFATYLNAQILRKNAWRF